MNFDNIYGMENLTMLDYDKHLSAILFYGGCSIRCPYCYNAGIVNRAYGKIPADEIIKFLKGRVNKLDAIVFSGGECTIHGENLYNDIKYCRELGYKIKLDTNGTNYELVKRLVGDGLVDYVALDYKCPACKKELFKFSETSYFNFKNTLNFLNNSSVPFEVRTTVHTDIITEEDIMEIIKDLDSIGYSGNYYIQFHFKSAPETISNVRSNPRPFNTEKITGTDKITIKYRNEQDNF